MEAGFALTMLRYALQMGGGALISHGLVEDAGAWEAISGGIVALATSVWGYFARKQLKAAATPA